MTTPVSILEFREEGSSFKDRILIHNKDEFKVEYQVRVPQDPRGFKHVTIKTGTWAGTPENNPPGMTQPTSLTFEGRSVDVALTEDDQQRSCFNYEGKVFVNTNSK